MPLLRVEGKIYYVKNFKDRALMGIKTTFLLKKTTQYSFIHVPFVLVQPLTHPNEFWVFSKMAHHSSLISRSSQLFKMAGSSQMIVVDVKIPTHVRFTKSNSPGLPDPPSWGKPMIGALRSNSTQ